MAQNRVCRCGRENSPKAKFCAACGGALEEQLCACGAKISATARFCAKCGTDVSTFTDPLQEAAVAKPGDSGGGEVSGNRWLRKSSDFACRIGVKQLSGVFGKHIKVESGSRAYLIRDGALDDILEAGIHKVQGTLGHWFSFLKKSQIEVVLVDTRPIMLPFKIPATRTKDRSTVEVDAAVQVEVSDAVSFLSGIMRGRQGLDHSTIRGVIEQHVQKLVGEELADVKLEELATADGRWRLQAKANARLDWELRMIGLTSVGMVVTPGPGTLSLSFTITSIDAPAPPLTINCPQCNGPVRATAKFCSGCGATVPREGDHHRPSNQIFTSDPAEVEYDIAISLKVPTGVGDSDLKPALFNALRGACRRHSKGYTFAELEQPERLAELEKKLEADLVPMSATLHAEITGLRIVDLRRKGGEWELQARADMEAAREQLAAGMQWLEIETKELDLQSMAEELALRRARDRQNTKIRMKSLELEGERAYEELSVEDRESRIPLLDRALKAENMERLLQAKSEDEWEQEAEKLELAKFLRRHEMDRLKAETLEGETDRVAAREHMIRLLRTQREFEVESLERDQEFQKIKTEQEREFELLLETQEQQTKLEDRDMDTQMRRENAALDHDQGLAGRAEDFRRKQTKEEIELERAKLDAELEEENRRKRQKIELESEEDLKDIEAAKRALELVRSQKEIRREDEEDTRRISREDEEQRLRAAREDQLAKEEAEHRRQMEAQQAEVEREVALRESMKGMSVEQLIAVMPAEQAAILGELQKTEQFKGMTPEQILASNPDVSEHAAAALQTKFAANVEQKQEMYERLMAEKEAAEAKAEATTDRVESIYKDVLDRQEREKSRNAEMFERFSEQQAAVITGTVARDRAAAEQRVDDMRERAADTRDLSREAMRSMGDVASSRAAPGPVVAASPQQVVAVTPKSEPAASPPPQEEPQAPEPEAKASMDQKDLATTCPNCSSDVPEGGVFCENCGTKVG